MKVFILVVFAILLSSSVFARVLINEIMYNPSGSDSSHEWLEIYNNGTYSIDIGGWKFYENDVNHALTPIYGKRVLNSGDYAIIADEWETFLLDYPKFNGTLIDSSWSSLSNSGEYVAIKNSSLAVTDWINYSAELANGNGKSLSLINNSWKEADPTPGYENIAPSEEDKPEEPEEPPAGHDVKLEVNIDDEINMHIEQTKLFKITNMNPEIGNVYDILIYYNLTKDDVIIKEDKFVKEDVNHYSTAGTGSFTPEGVGNYTLCGKIINSTADDNNPGNDYACKNFSVIDTSSIPCNVSINITIDNEIYAEGESIKFYNNLNNETFPFTIEYWIQDLFSSIYKDKHNTTNTNQKSWKTNIEEQDRVLLIKSKVYPNCNDSNSSDNFAEKMFIVKSESDDFEKAEESILKITEVDEEVKFGDTANVKVNIYKGKTNKYSISLWIERSGEKVSETTKIHLYDKYSFYNGQLPIKLDPNCDLKLENGKYDVVIKGLDKEDKKEIKIEGVKASYCSASSSVKTNSSSAASKKFEYEIIEFQDEIDSDDIKSKVKLTNNDDEDYNIKIWSYVYRGSKCYSGDREANKKEILLAAGTSEIMDLKNDIIGANPGEYKYKVVINKDNQKTNKEIIKEMLIKDQLKENKQVSDDVLLAKKNSEVGILPENKSEITPAGSYKLKIQPTIYESVDEKIKKSIFIFLITLSIFLNVILIWRR